MYNNVFSQNKAILNVVMNVECICLNTKSNSIMYISRLVNFFEATIVMTAYSALYLQSVHWNTIKSEVKVIYS